MKSDSSIIVESYGIYTPWDSKTSDLPRIKQYTTDIPIGPDVEFGILLNIKKHKNSKLTFTVDHPQWEENGKVVPPFEGEAFIKTNDYHYFIGDRFWEPYENKAGTWHISVWINQKVVASQSFTAILP